MISKAGIVLRKVPWERVSKGRRRELYYYIEEFTHIYDTIFGFGSA